MRLGSCVNFEVQLVNGISSHFRNYWPHPEGLSECVSKHRDQLQRNCFLFSLHWSVLSPGGSQSLVAGQGRINEVLGTQLLCTLGFSPFLFSMTFLPPPCPVAPPLSHPGPLGLGHMGSTSVVFTLLLYVIGHPDKLTARTRASVHMHKVVPSHLLLILMVKDNIGYMYISTEIILVTPHCTTAYKCLQVMIKFVYPHVCYIRECTKLQLKNHPVIKMTTLILSSNTFDRYWHQKLLLTSLEHICAMFWREPLLLLQFVSMLLHHQLRQSDI